MHFCNVKLMIRDTGTLIVSVLFSNFEHAGITVEYSSVLNKCKTLSGPFLVSRAGDEG